MSQPSSSQYAVGDRVEAIKPGGPHARSAQVLEVHEDTLVLRFPGAEVHTVPLDAVVGKKEHVVANIAPVIPQNQLKSVPAAAVVDLTLDDDEVQQVQPHQNGPWDRTQANGTCDPDIDAIERSVRTSWHLRENDGTFYSSYARGSSSRQQHNDYHRPAKYPERSRTRRPSFALSSLSASVSPEPDSYNPSDDFEFTARLQPPGNSLSQRHVSFPLPSRDHIESESYQRANSFNDQYPSAREARGKYYNYEDGYYREHENFERESSASLPPSLMPRGALRSVSSDQEQRLGLSGELASVSIPRRALALPAQYRRTTSGDTESFYSRHPNMTLDLFEVHNDEEALNDNFVYRRNGKVSVANGHRKPPKAQKLSRVHKETSSGGMNSEEVQSTENERKLAVQSKSRRRKRSAEISQEAEKKKQQKQGKSKPLPKQMEEVVASGGPRRRSPGQSFREKTARAKARLRRRILSLQKRTYSEQRRRLSNKIQAQVAQSLAKESVETVSDSDETPDVPVISIESSSPEHSVQLPPPKPPREVCTDETRGSGRRKGRPRRNAGQAAIALLAGVENEKFAETNSCKLIEDVNNFADEESKSCPILNVSFHDNERVYCKLCGGWSHRACAGLCKLNLEALFEDESVLRQMLCVDCAEIAFAVEDEMNKLRVSKKWSVSPFALCSREVKSRLQRTLHSVRRRPVKRKTNEQTAQVVRSEDDSPEVSDSESENEFAHMLHLSEEDVLSMERNVESFRTGLIPRSIHEGSVANLTVYK